ncbi:MAG: hypothetical protein V1659_03535 [Candidatus Woesearchaeota archaeon]
MNDKINKTALTGLHNTKWIDSENESIVKEILEMKGYYVISTHSLDDMLSKMGLSQESQPELLPGVGYDLYIMDLNLDNRGDDSCEPALKIYSHIKDDIKHKKAKFIGISGNPITLENAEKNGIFCINLCYIFNTLKDYI